MEGKERRVSVRLGTGRWRSGGGRKTGELGAESGGAHPVAFPGLEIVLDRMLDVARLGLDEEAVDDRAADLGKDLEVDPQSQQGE
jgi:hypothetical protein